MMKIKVTLEKMMAVMMMMIIIMMMGMAEMAVSRGMTEDASVMCLLRCFDFAKNRNFFRLQNSLGV